MHASMECFLKCSSFLWAFSFADWNCVSLSLKAVIISITAYPIGHNDLHTSIWNQLTKYNLEYFRSVAINNVWCHGRAHTRTWCSVLIVLIQNKYPTGGVPAGPTATGPSTLLRTGSSEGSRTTQRGVVVLSGQHQGSWTETVCTIICFERSHTLFLFHHFNKNK